MEPFLIVSFFPCSSSLQLRVYSHATWASDHSNHRSLLAYCVFLGLLFVVSCSSIEAELQAMAVVTMENTWLWWLLEDFPVPVTTLTHVSFDSTSAISIVRDTVNTNLPIILELTPVI